MKKIVPFESDKMRNLKYGMNALIELEKALGKPITNMGDEFKLEDLRTMLYIGLKWEDKELTFEKVGDMMDETIEKHGMNYISEKLSEALQGTFGNTAIPFDK